MKLVLIRKTIVSLSFPWLMVISRSLKENGQSNLVKGKLHAATSISIDSLAS